MISIRSKWVSALSLGWVCFASMVDFFKIYIPPASGQTVPVQKMWVFACIQKYLFLFSRSPLFFRLGWLMCVFFAYPPGSGQTVPVQTMWVFECIKKYLPGTSVSLPFGFVPFVIHSTLHVVCRHYFPPIVVYFSVKVFQCARARGFARSESFGVFLLQENARQGRVQHGVFHKSRGPCRSLTYRQEVLCRMCAAQSRRRKPVIISGFYGPHPATRTTTDRIDRDSIHPERSRSSSGHEMIYLVCGLQLCGSKSVFWQTKEREKWRKLQPQACLETRLTFLRTAVPVLGTI